MRTTKADNSAAQNPGAALNAFKLVGNVPNKVSVTEALVKVTDERIAESRQGSCLPDLRYTNGYSSSLEVLNAQRDLSQAESSVIDAKRAQLSRVVALYKAVGGGWAAP